tara:strand:- start:26 stop:373 length:348 start_codon:yes stop_codon:yes gene_type:complete
VFNYLQHLEIQKQQSVNQDLVAVNTGSLVVAVVVHIMVQHLPPNLLLAEQAEVLADHMLVVVMVVTTQMEVVMKLQKIQAVAVAVAPEQAVMFVVAWVVLVLSSSPIPNDKYLKT